MANSSTLRFIAFLLKQSPWSYGTFSWCKSFHERPPRRLAHVTSLLGEALLHASIAGYRGQYTTTPYVTRVEDHAAVGREARRFVDRAVGEQLHLACREILHRDTEASALALNEREALAVGAVTRRYVVGSVEREALRLSARSGHAID